MKTNKYEIKNKTDESADLMLYGIIGDYWDEMDAKDIVGDIAAMDVGTINVQIYSNGGSVFAGLAIYNALKKHRAKINVHIDSLAASIASVIAMAGTVTMPKNAFLMIHNPWSWTEGDASAFKKMAEVLSKIKDSLISVYAEKTGKSTDELSTLMDDETWMTAEEAVNSGFADYVEGAAVVDDAARMEIMNTLKNFKNVPAPVLAALSHNKPSHPGQNNKGKNHMDFTLENLKKNAPELLASIQAAAIEGKQDEIKTALLKGATHERERIQAVFAQSLAGHEALVETLAFDGKTSGPEAAVQVLAAEKVRMATAAQNLAADGITPVAATQPPEPPPADDAPVADEAAFNADQKLKAEFGDFATYHAYTEAMGAGLARVINHKDK